MNTLTIAPLAPILERLFAEADVQEADFDRALSGLTEAEQARLMQSKTEYTALYGRLHAVPLAVSRETGTLLYMLARGRKARSIVEFGTSFGISALYLAAALRDNGGGRLITTELEPSKAARARNTFRQANVADLVELREGDALQTLSVDLPERIDLVLLDGAKALYPDILNLLEPRLQTGALIVADNADYSPEYLERVRRRDGGYMSTAVSDEVELTMRLAA